MLAEPGAVLGEAALAGATLRSHGVCEVFPPGTPGWLSADVRGALKPTAEDLRSLVHDVVESDIGLRRKDTSVIASLLFRGIRDQCGKCDPSDSSAGHGPWPGPVRWFGPCPQPPEGVGARARRPCRSRLRRRRRPAHADDLPAGGARSADGGPGRDLTYLWATGWVPLNVLWNSTGQPAASVPAGVTADGLPLEVQLVGRPHAETTVLSVLSPARGRSAVGGTTP